MMSDDRIPLMTDILHVAAPVHGRVLHLARDPERLIVGFHGYAETAEVHMAELEKLAGDWSLAAVQALHPFYTRDQRIVASWMTSLDREQAIADNIEYVRRAVAALPPARRLIFAGFSQGAAMAWRAASALPCHGVIAAVVAIGGDLPPDVQPPFPRALICRGEGDEWYTAAKLAADLARHPAAESFVHPGGHEWNDQVRARVGEWLGAIAESGD
jgi:dienelactone hydrolase